MTGIRNEGKYLKIENTEVRGRFFRMTPFGVEWGDYQNERYYELRQLYERYEKLYATLQDYRSVLDNISGIAYLDKALELGHISTIEYFLESNYFYMAYSNYLQTENDYHQVKAELF